MTGQTLSHYRVLERIGEGATSVVYKAEDLALGRPVALKLLPAGLPSDFGVVARFQHEARTTSSLTHPNICTIYEIGEHQGRHFIVMEFLEGQVLSKVIAGRPLDCYRLLEIAIQISDGLAAAHAEGVIHQDVKPANIYVTQRDHVKLLDFGLAVLMPASTGDRSASAQWLAGGGGTAPYMSPEQTQGEPLDPRSDLFSVGITLYEMATGRRPFTGGTNAELMEAIRAAMPPAARQLNPGIPTELDRIIEKALEKNRKLRYQTASDMGADLRRLKRDLDTQNRVFVPPAMPASAIATATVRVPSRVIRQRRWAIAAGIAAAGVGALTYSSYQTTGAARSESGDSAAASSASVSVPASSSSPANHAFAGPPPAPAERPAAPSAAKAERVSRDDPRPSAGGTRSIDAPAVDLRQSQAARDHAREWAEEQLAGARSKVELRLYDQAIASLDALLGAEAPADVALDAYLLLATIHETRDRRDDAIAAYLDISTRYPDSARAPEAMLRMANALLGTRRKGKEEEALKIYGDLAQRYPTSRHAPRALLAKGELEERRNQYQRDAVLSAVVPTALVTYRQIIGEYPQSPEREEALWKLAQMYQRIKRYDLAAAALTYLGDEFPASGHDAWFAAGEIFDKRLKAPSDARAAYARVPSTSPKFEEAQKRLARR